MLITVIDIQKSDFLRLGYKFNFHVHIHCRGYTGKCFYGRICVAVLYLADVSLIYACKFGKLFLSEIVGIAAGNEHLGKLIFGSKSFVFPAKLIIGFKTAV